MVQWTRIETRSAAPWLPEARKSRPWRRIWRRGSGRRCGPKERARGPEGRLETSNVLSWGVGTNLHWLLGRCSKFVTCALPASARFAKKRGSKMFSRLGKRWGIFWGALRCTVRELPCTKPLVGRSVGRCIKRKEWKRKPLQTQGSASGIGTYTADTDAKRRIAVRFGDIHI